MPARSRSRIGRVQAAVAVTTAVLAAGVIAFHIVVPLLEAATERGRRPW